MQLIDRDEESAPRWWTAPYRHALHSTHIPEQATPTECPGAAREAPALTLQALMECEGGLKSRLKRKPHQHLSCWGNKAMQPC
ncbi:hypothetical protein FKM82_015372 [Ascaphus truei]